MIIREAVRADLPAVIALLADDVLGKAREFATVESTRTVSTRGSDSSRATRA